MAKLDSDKSGSDKGSGKTSGASGSSDKGSGKTSGTSGSSDKSSGKSSGRSSSSSSDRGSSKTSGTSGSSDKSSGKSSGRSSSSSSGSGKLSSDSSSSGRASKNSASSLMDESSDSGGKLSSDSSSSGRASKNSASSLMDSSSSDSGVRSRFGTGKTRNSLEAAMDKQQDSYVAANGARSGGASSFNDDFQALISMTNPMSQRERGKIGGYSSITDDKQQDKYVAGTTTASFQDQMDELIRLAGPAAVRPDRSKPRNSLETGVEKRLDAYAARVAADEPTGGESSNPMQWLSDFMAGERAVHDANVEKRRAAGEPVWTPNLVDGTFDLLASEQAIHDANVEKRRAAGEPVLDVGASLEDLYDFLAEPARERKKREETGKTPPGYNALTPSQRNAISKLPEDTAKQTIDAVSPVVEKMTYDPTQPGGWMYPSGGSEPRLTPSDAIPLEVDAHALANPAAFDAAYTPLPRPRPDRRASLPGPLPEGEGGQDLGPAATINGSQWNIPTSDPWQSMRTPGDELVSLAAVGPSAPTGVRSDIWTNVVDGAGKVLESTALGGVVKGLFPDFWKGTGEFVKDLGIVTPGRTGPASANSIFDMGNDSHTDSRSGWSVTGGPPTTSGGLSQYPVTPTDQNGNGIPDINEGGSPGGGGLPNYRAVFPGLGYRPGIDPEWDYFPGMAQGGLVRGYAEGGAVSPMAGMDPRIELIADAMDALTGKSPNPEAAIEAFIEAFGEEAFQALVAEVQKGGGEEAMEEPGGRMVQGPGGPIEDAIPARIDRVQEARLSDGEFVMPAAAVVRAGDGDSRLGAERLSMLSDQLSGNPAAGLRVERVG